MSVSPILVVFLAVIMFNLAGLTRPQLQEPAPPGELTNEPPIEPQEPPPPGGPNYDPPSQTETPVSPPPKTLTRRNPPPIGVPEKPEERSVRKPIRPPPLHS
ncbi:uncharacterized protein LOC133292955 [Gastrolobium bilobum]|uniref:uncharacterized protein LOC133292955 n=1 Tax=Gastrolobium bilobum TaxID=150636 RepID=UPI002AB1276A|nr:uncharacterized protein LOC133292955 [Gastrolobium bilobum]